MICPTLPISILAQNPKGGGPDLGLFIGVILMIAVFYIIILSPGRKEKKKRQEMLDNVKKSDRVMTIGGILGSVVNVNENEVTLKVDESANVKITVIRSAIQKVLTEGEKPTNLQ